MQTDARSQHAASGLVPGLASGLHALASGMLFAGAVLGIPVALLADNRPHWLVAVLCTVGLASAVAVWFAPRAVWTRAGIHLGLALATIEVAVAATLFDPVFGLYTVFVILFAAFAFSRFADVVPHLALTAAALLTPAIASDSLHDRALMYAVIGIPSLALIAGMTFYLQSELVRARLAQAELSAATLEIAERIHRAAAGSQPAEGKLERTVPAGDAVPAAEAEAPRPRAAARPR